jgi:RimJ/RimL family protein N-acetyltransferase
MKDKNAFYYIGEINSQPIGLVRFDKESEKEAVAGILIDKQYRGKGLASEFLKKSCTEYLKINQTEIIAYIKIENAVSIKSFEKAGFNKQYGENTVIYNKAV